MKLQITVQNQQAMQQLAAVLAQQLSAGDVVALVGDLGAGKTTLVKAIGKSLGVKTAMTSPTYTLVNQYRAANVSVVHADVYRLENSEALYEIGFEDYITADALVLIEWANLIADWLISEVSSPIWITIDYAALGRLVTIEGEPLFISRIEDSYVTRS